MLHRHTHTQMTKKFSTQTPYLEKFLLKFDIPTIHFHMDNVIIDIGGSCRFDCNGLENNSRQYFCEIAAKQIQFNLFFFCTLAK